ncbi:MAG: divergent polysaccharide deacetylase family protein [Paracoccaceae bacterium]|nr:divergent polysaccharide deacetylase family protein [Paracoccaceae bacterium]
MGRGFLAGIFWGGLLGLALLVIAGMTVDRRQLSFPQPDATPVEVPAGTEFDQARPETEPVVPQAETPPKAEVVSGVTPPEDVVEAPPAFDTSSLEVPTPSVEGPSALGEVPEVSDGVSVDVTGPGVTSLAPEAPAGALAVPEVPAAAPETAVEAPEAAPEPEPVEEEVAATPAPAEEPTPETPAPEPVQTAEEPRVLPQATESAAAPVQPVAPVAPAQPMEAPSGSGIVTVDGGDSAFFTPVEEMGNLAPEIETDRLPRIGTPPATEQTGLPAIRRIGEDEEAAAEAPEAPEQAAPAPPPAVEGGPALQAWRQGFENPEGNPLVSIVLIHEGSERLSSDELAALPEGVSFAVNAGQPGANELASQYRRAGREVVMIPSLPMGATPQDVEQALRVNFETVPEAVAVMDNSGDSFQSDRAAVAQVVDVVAASGHGLITFPRGLNTAHQRAERAGVATGLIFRDMDGDGQSGEQIQRALDRAAFRARQDEAVILVGRTSRRTIGAVVEWTLGNRAASVALAPVSAALLDG